MARQKRGKPISLKDSVLRKRKMNKQGSVANDDKNLKEQIVSEEQIVYEKTKTLDNIQTLHEERSLKGS